MTSAGGTMPELDEIAAKLAAIAADLPGEGNPFRAGLDRVGAHLAPGTRNLAEARRELVRIVYFGTGDDELADLPETWIACACVALLAADQIGRASTASASGPRC